MAILFKPVGKSKTVFPVVLIIVVVFLVYLPTLNGGFLWDDDVNIVDNFNFRGFSASHLRWMFTTFHDGNYHPLCWMTFGFDFVLWGLNPAGYHLTNLLLHLSNAALFYFLIVLFLRRVHIPVADNNLFGVQSGAFVGALFFAIHPLRVESVAWISTRGDLLCCLYYMLSIIAYVKMAQKQAAGDRRKWLLISLILFILSLLSRAWGITFPLVLLILDIYPLRRFTWGGKFTASQKMVLAEKIWFLMFALAAGILAFLAKKVDMLVVTEYGIFDRFVQAAYGISFYIFKTIVPVRLSPLYFLDKSFDPMALKYILCVFFVIGIMAGLFAMRKKWPWAITSWFCYVVIVSPLLGFVQSGPQVAADRYTYISCLPFGVLAGAGMFKLWTMQQKKALFPAMQHAAVCGSLLFVALMSVLSLYQTRVWKDGGTLWSRVIQVDPDNYIAYNDRGNFYSDTGDPVRALKDYNTAIRLKPDFNPAFYNRAVLRHQLGNLSGALADYNTVIRLNPKSVEAYTNRGSLFHQKMHMDRALADYNAAIRLNPSSPEAYFNRGVIRQAQDDFGGAIQDLNRALEVATAGWPHRAWGERRLNNVRKRMEA